MAGWRGRMVGQVSTTIWLALQIIGTAATIVVIYQLARHKPVVRWQLMVLLVFLGAVVVAQGVQLYLRDRDKPDKDHLIEVKRWLSTCSVNVGNRQASGLVTLAQHQQSSLNRHYKREVKRLRQWDKFVPAVNEARQRMEDHFNADVIVRGLVSPEFVNTASVWQFVLARASEGTTRAPVDFQWRDPNPSFGYWFWFSYPAGGKPQVILTDDDPAVVEERKAIFESCIRDALTWPETTNYEQLCQVQAQKAAELTAKVEVTLRSQRKHVRHCDDC